MVEQGAEGAEARQGKAGQCRGVRLLPAKLSSFGSEHPTDSAYPPFPLLASPIRPKLAKENFGARESFPWSKLGCEGADGQGEKAGKFWFSGFGED